MTPEEAFIKATKLRAKVYYYFYEELAKEIGYKKAGEIIPGLSTSLESINPAHLIKNRIQAPNYWQWNS